MSSNEQRQEIEREVVRHLIREMKAKGWMATKVDDGGEIDEVISCTTETEVMDAVFAVDEAQILFEKGGEGHWVLIVLGNDGYDAIADYSYTEGGEFEAIMNEIQEWTDKFDDSAMGG